VFTTCWSTARRRRRPPDGPIFTAGSLLPGDPVAFSAPCRTCSSSGNAAARSRQRQGHAIDWPGSVRRHVRQRRLDQWRERHRPHHRDASTARLRSTVRATFPRSATSFGNNGTGRPRDAFLDDNLLVIWQGDNDHRQPFPGDHDIPFSPVIGGGPSRGTTRPHAGGLRGSLPAPPPGDARWLREDCSGIRSISSRNPGQVSWLPPLPPHRSSAATGGEDPGRSWYPGSSGSSGSSIHPIGAAA